MSKIKEQLLIETFENEFNLQRYKTFINEFFNSPKMLNDSRMTEIWKEYSEHIEAYYTIAEYTDAEYNNIIVLAVELKKSTSVDRARSMQRNFISKILSEHSLESAIVAFYAKDNPFWRLSYVRLDYSFGDLGLELELTPAKRYSYLVGKDEPNHTALKQLYPIFSDSNHNPTVDEIENAFSVEKVTRDFFEQYKEKYFELKEYLEDDKDFINETKKLGFKLEKFSEQFSKKLMGQLVFLYFIQKKGWLGVKLVPEIISFKDYENISADLQLLESETLKKYYVKNAEKYKLKANEIKNRSFSRHNSEALSNIFTETKFDENWGEGSNNFIRDELWNDCILNNKNFFLDYLEPLFYNGLNMKRKNNYYNLFNCKIPFLNGGLFEPIEGYDWENTKFNIPNTFFSNFVSKGRYADGLLDIFDRYNFTINESEAFEKDVAIDPEMLGKIFEELLEISDRKSKGAFYTPREIVHHMCQDTLSKYLSNKLDISFEEVNDFIVYGDLIRDYDKNKDVSQENLKINENIFKNIVAIDDALKNVKIADPAVGSGAYPLGILNEIVRIRNNITEYLIKTDEISDTISKYSKEDILKRRSIYNLKINTIKNSIYAVDIEKSAVDITKLRLWLSIVIEEDSNIKNFSPRPLPNLDMNIHVGNSLIDEFKGTKLFDDSILRKRKQRKNVQMSLLFDPDAILEELFKLQSVYFDLTDEREKVLLKNKMDSLRDDYIQSILIESGYTKELEEYKKLKEDKNTQFFIWELEFGKVFKNNKGFDIVIGNPPYAVKFDNKTKKLLKQKYPEVPDYESAYYFISKSYELLKDSGILSFIIPNTILVNFYGKNLRNKLIKDWQIVSIDNLSELEVFESAAVRNCILTLEKEKKIKFDAMFNQGDIINSQYIHADTKYISNKLLSNFIDNWLKLFYQTEIETNLIDKIKSSATILNKLSNVSQGLIPYDKYTGQSEDIIKNRVYHANYKIDQTYGKELRGRDITDRYNLKWSGEHWLSYGDWLAAPREKKYFEDERILIREITNPRLIATSTKDTYYNSPSIINIVDFEKVPTNYILGLLNSKLLSYYHNQTSPKASKGLFPKILVNDVRNLPIKIGDQNEIKYLNELVDEILITSDQDRFTELDAKIDDLVYDIYNLSKKEIELVVKFFE